MSETSAPVAKVEPDPKYTVGTLTYTKAGLVILFGWLLWGDFVFTLFESIGGPGILGLYLQDNFHLSSLQCNIMFSFIPNLIGVIVGPILSFKSDRYRGRRGRRIPFIIWTTPFLCLFAAAIGYADDIFAFSKAHIAPDSIISPFNASLIAIGVLVIGFSFFNEFVNTVFWYLFADVVPEHFIGRFMGLFRVAGAAAGFLINVLIAAHQLTHMRIIHVGVAALYFFGFSLMCWRVREGSYPPVTDVTEKTTLMEQVKIYAKECFTHKLFILIYLSTFIWVFSRACPITRMFELHLGQHVAESPAHPGRVEHLAMSADASRILTTGNDGAVSVWDGTHPEKIPGPFWDAVRRAKLTTTRTLQAAGSPQVSALAMTADGAIAASGATNGNISIWSLTDGTIRTNFPAHAGKILATAISPDGTMLASGGADQTVRLWDLQSGRCLQTLSGHTGEVRSVAFSSDGRRLASCGMDSLLLVHSVGSGTLELTITAPGPLYTATFVPSLKPVPPPVRPDPTPFTPLNIVLRYIDLPGYLSNVFSTHSLYETPVGQRTSITSQDGWLVAGGRDDGADSRNARLRIWAADSGTLVKELRGHKQAITSVRYKQDIRMLLSGSLDKSSRLWDLADVSSTADDQSLKTFSGYMSGVTCVAVVNQGTQLLCGTDSGSLHLWNIDAGISLRNAGMMASFFGILSLILSYPFGALVDRFHALRVTLICAVLTIPIPLITYFCMRDYYSLFVLEAVKLPLFGLLGAAGMPMLIALLPKDKFGQMCSANGLVKQLSAMLLGLLGASIADWFTRGNVLIENARYSHLWTFAGFLMYAVILVAIYREWLKLGGKAAYKAPAGEKKEDTP